MTSTKTVRLIYRNFNWNVVSLHVIFSHPLLYGLRSWSVPFLGPSVPHYSCRFRRLFFTLFLTSFLINSSKCSIFCNCAIIIFIVACQPFLQYNNSRLWDIGHFFDLSIVLPKRSFFRVYLGLQLTYIPRYLFLYESLLLQLRHALSSSFYLIIRPSYLDPRHINSDWSPFTCFRMFFGASFINFYGFYMCKYGLRTVWIFNSAAWFHLGPLCLFLGIFLG